MRAGVSAGRQLPGWAQIDKQSSHGCVRLTNWGTEELAELVAVGAEVEFLD